MLSRSVCKNIDAYRRGFLALGAGTCVSALFVAPPAIAASARELDQSADAALKRLYAANQKALELSSRARGMLVFPKITKAGFIVGGQEGEGVLRVKGLPNAYYRIAAASLGLQAGAQTFSFVMFFITQSALDYLNRSEGWAIGSGPSVVVADSGVAKSMNTTTLNQDVYAMAFGQKGLMAALGIEGSKITRIHPGA